MEQQSRWVGRVLREKWQIDARIARGGVGTVFAATHKKNGNRVAIKVLHPQFSRDNDTRSRFLQEGYAANQVNHPGVVRILDDDVTEEGLAFLVMELLEGELLEKRRVRKGGRLALSEVYEIADQLLDVLAAAHEKGIVHRDIKPDNLFVTNDGRVKVLDFGFAQMKSGFRKEQTATGFLLGTPGFMSPEQAAGKRALIDDKTDIWAAGATMFTLYSGQPVHAGESAAQMLVAAANFPPRSLSTVAADAPPTLVHIVDKALAFHKKDRFGSAREMQLALRDVPGRHTAAPRRSLPDIDVGARSGLPETLRSATDEVRALELDELETVPFAEDPHAARRSNPPELSSPLRPRPNSTMPLAPRPNSNAPPSLPRSSPSNAPRPATLPLGRSTERPAAHTGGPRARDVGGPAAPVGHSGVPHRPATLPLGQTHDRPIAPRTVASTTQPLPPRGPYASRPPQNSPPPPFPSPRVAPESAEMPTMTNRAPAHPADEPESTLVMDGRTPGGGLPRPLTGPVQAVVDPSSLPIGPITPRPRGLHTPQEFRPAPGARSAIANPPAREPHRHRAFSIPDGVADPMRSGEYGALNSQASIRVDAQAAPARAQPSTAPRGHVAVRVEAPGPSPARSVLVFFGVAVLSMLLVVATGLLIMAGTE